MRCAKTFASSPAKQCPDDFVGEIFIGGSNKATVLRAATEDYFRRSELAINLDHGVDNMARAMSLVAFTGGLALMPALCEESAARVRGQPSVGG